VLEKKQLLFNYTMQDSDIKLVSYYYKFEGSIIMFKTIIIIIIINPKQELLPILTEESP